MALEERLAVAPDVDDPQQEVLGGDELVAEAPGLLGRALQHAAGARIERHLAAGDLGPAGEERGELAPECGQVDAHAAQRLGGDALVVLHERGEEMLGVEDRALQALGERLGAGDRLLRLLGETFEVHGVGSCSGMGVAGSLPGVGILLRPAGAGRAGGSCRGRRRLPPGPRRGRSGGRPGCGR